MFLSLSLKRQHSPNALCFFEKWDKMLSQSGTAFQLKRLLQSGTAFLLQSGTKVVTKWDRCYKMRQMLLQSGTGVTKCDDCYKLGSNRH